MEKSVILGIIIMLCFFGFKAQAQSTVGVKAGANVSNFWINESSNLESNGNTNENDPLWPIQIAPLNLLPKKVKVASKNIPVFT